MPIDYTHAWCSWRPNKHIRLHGDGFIGMCELPVISLLPEQYTF